jgi:hypothetical protein
MCLEGPRKTTGNFRQAKFEKGKSRIRSCSAFALTVYSTALNTYTTFLYNLKTHTSFPFPLSDRVEGSGVAAPFILNLSIRISVND